MNSRMDPIGLPPSIWTTGTTESIKTGTWRAALPAYAASTLHAARHFEIAVCIAVATTDALVNCAGAPAGL